jgi:hypothetical protein
MSEPRTWLIYDTRSECYWGPDRGGYWKSIANAGLYTEAEARDAEDFARRYGRAEVAVPLTNFGAEIKRLAAALSEAEAANILLGPETTGAAPTSRPDLQLLIEMANDWTDPVVVRDAPGRAADVVRQLVEALESLRKEARA